MSSPPLSARFAMWFSAWRAGAASLDEARDEIVGRDAAHDVVGLDGDDLPLILALGRLRALGATSAGIALPTPGDPLGLAGPPEFNTEALQHGEAVVLDGCEVGLVPLRCGTGVVWRALPATSPRQVQDPSEADTALRQALLAASDALAALDVPRRRPELADELTALRNPADLCLPACVPARSHRMIALATRCRTIVALALEDDGAAVSSFEADRRREALVPLDKAARRALVAACSLVRQG